MNDWTIFWHDTATNWLDAGYYKIRRFSRGPWCPVRLWWDGECDWETGENLEDEILRAEWAPHPRKVYWWPFDLINRGERLHKSDKEEFEWLIALKNL